MKRGHDEQKESEQRSHRSISRCAKLPAGFRNDMLPTIHLPALRKSTRAARALLAPVLLGATFAHAHDFWIEPASFRPAVGVAVPLRLYVGQHFKGDTVIYLPELFERYSTVGPDGEKPIAGIAGDDPAGSFTPKRAGLHIVVYRGTVTSVSFDNEPEFERYLGTEGLERVRTLRNYRAPRADKPVVELYSRCSKALVAAGGATAGAIDRVLGLRLELIAEKDPYTRGAARALPVRLLFENKPLADALVVAFNKAEPMEKIKLRTDRDGRAVVKLARPGTWLVTSVHMFPAPATSRADWESVWASLTFEVP
jgi:uncharacterized GH25 family protein